MGGLPLQSHRTFYCMDEWIAKKYDIDARMDEEI
jgi:hypothetical protein